MKKIMATILGLIILGMAAIPVGAQNPYRGSRNRTYQSRSYDNRRYDDRYDNRSFVEKHRDVLTTAGGAVGGALIGGLIGGRKGALIGALAGGGGAAVYSYKIRPQRRY